MNGLSGLLFSCRISDELLVHMESLFTSLRIKRTDGGTLSSADTTLVMSSQSVSIRAGMQGMVK